MNIICKKTLTHYAVHLKLTQYCKSIIPQLKNRDGKLEEDSAEETRGWGKNKKTIIISFLNKEKTQHLLVPTGLKVNQASPR